MSRRHSFTAAVRAEPLSSNGQRILRDPKLPGLFVVIGKRTKTWTVQSDVKVLGGRKTRRKALGRVGEMPEPEARRLAKQWLSEAANGALKPRSGVTLEQAWQHYCEYHLEAEGRSQNTILDYQACIERLLRCYLAVPLVELSERAGEVADLHRKITRANGPAAADHAMRSLRTVYRYARRHMDKSLPVDHPADMVKYNPKADVDDALRGTEFPAWWAQLNDLPNPIRREFHLFCLLSGSRAGALAAAEWGHLDVGRRTLHFPRPKGGEAKAFDMPLSREMLRCEDGRW